LVVVFVICRILIPVWFFHSLTHTHSLNHPPIYFHAFILNRYNDDWNANMPSILASSYVSISTAVAYTTPFLGAILADNLLGEYMTILLGSIICYIPGLLLIALTTIPQFLGQEFNHSAIRWGLLILWPMGTGTVKACVNVFGAKQFHPILQSSFIESYYVNFYMCINIGALTGGIVVPLVAQQCITLAYFIPVGMLGLGVLMFVVGTKRYVRPRPSTQYVRRMVEEKMENWCGGCCCNWGWRRNLEPPLPTMGTTKSPSPSKLHDRMAMNIQSSQAESKVGVGTIALLSGLVVPFNVAYAQMATTFIVQGSVMTNFGVVDAPMMNNADAVSVLAFGYIIGNVIYPELNRRGIKIPTTYKFAIGSAFGALAVGCAILTDYRIHQVYEESGEAITVLWQVFPYFLIGIGEIFAVSAAYELAFTVAPSKMKSVASAANLFMVGGLPNVVCIMLYNACRGWFLNKHGEARIHKLHDYASAKVVNYFWLVEAIALFGVVINILPSVKNWVESIEETAAESINSPISTPVIRKKLMQKKQYRSQHSSLGSSTEEETPLINSQKHANYLKYTERPELRKMGSFRAGPSSKSKKSGPAVLPQYQHRLLKSPEAKEQLYLQVNNAFAPHAADATGNKST
jgi:POT family proton-dependent oligopeptide transporter